MREIKFRAWDKRQGIWVSDKQIKKNFNQYYKQPNFVLMQSTGLPDAQGQEIWQGDILDASYINPMTGENVVKLYTVIPGDDKCDACKAKHFKHKLYDTPLFLVNSRTKVIGNIFENPELLETEAGE